MVKYTCTVALRKIHIVIIHMSALLVVLLYGKVGMLCMYSVMCNQYIMSLAFHCWITNELVWFIHLQC